MELLRGETLSERLSRKGTFTIAEALPVIKQMASALASAHAAGIVHRDFKSNNVMLVDGSGSQPMRVVVTDFGLAHRMEEYGAGDRGAITATGDLVGTPDYMAPEQVEGKPVTPGTDVYALGIVLYEMLTGRRPFKAETPFASALLRITGPPPTTPRKLNPDVPDRLGPRDHALPGASSRRPLSGCDGRGRCARAASLRRLPAARPRFAAHRRPCARGRLARGRHSWCARCSAEEPCSGSTADRPSTTAATSVDTARPAVAVLGFRNLAGRADVQWLSVALSEMLTTELGAAEKVRTVPGENVNRMKTELSLADADSYNAETLARIRKNVGADIVVAGSYVTVGEGDGATLRVDIRIQDAQQGQTLSLVSETGKSAELLDLVSRAGGQLRERLGIARSRAR